MRKRECVVTLACAAAVLVGCSRQDAGSDGKACGEASARAAPVQPPEARAGCASNVAFFGDALRRYASGRDGAMPVNVMVFAEAASADASRFICPSGTNRLSDVAEPDSWGDYAFPCVGGRNVGPTHILAYCQRCLNRFGETAAAQTDGRVIRLSSGELPARLAEQKAASGPSFRFDPGAENSGGFRGPNRDGRFPAKGLLTKWPEGGPKLAWKATIAHGWSAAAVAGGSVYFCGATGNGMMWCFSLDGELRWLTSYGPEGEKHGAQPRATPVAADGRLFYTSMARKLICMDASDGKVLWRTDLKPLCNKVESASPLLCGDLIVVSASSGSVEQPSFVALRARDGSLAWKGNLGPCPEEGKGWSCFHSSPILVQARDRRLVVDQFYRCLGAVDAETGEKVWTEITQSGKVAPTSNEGYLLMQGERMFKVLDGGRVEKLWQRGLGIQEYGVCYSHSMIVGGRLYAYTPGGVRMIDARTGAEIARASCVGGSGSLQMAEGLLYVLDGRPRMTLLRPTDTTLEEVSSFTPDIRGGTDLYTHAVIAEGRLFLRNQASVCVYDLRAP